MNKFMNITVKEAFSGLEQNDGGPFGAVVVKNGEVIARSHNQVIKTNDPTAHAEVLAIREASRKLETFDLSDCEIYSSCEPCPMCFSAIYWARIKKIYYGCTTEDASKIGFDDEFVYDIMKGTFEKEWILVEQIDREECLKPFKKWEETENKTQY